MISLCLLFTLPDRHCAQTGFEPVTSASAAALFRSASTRRCSWRRMKESNPQPFLVGRDFKSRLCPARHPPELHFRRCGDHLRSSLSTLDPSILRLAEGDCTRLCTTTHSAENATPKPSILARLLSLPSNPLLGSSINLCDACTRASRC